ncbi:PAS domain S-box protein [Phenylobacterium montanum]|uniref:histidine kinase n=1 Tax=Phenylobacterium montanum TaxID=2823693 RepID=A0A975FZB9_9CAUL|nr:PAS domain S-box protein [Caulobacter sp. S6]QUD88258.1 PAS domain S-box protein [Caulobacter sp. S6]
MFVTTWLSVLISTYTKGVVPIWPANAVVLAAMLARPEGQWAPLLAFGFVGGLLGNLAGGNPTALSVILSASNAIEVSICSFGLRFVLKGPPDFSKRRDLVTFVLLCSAAAITSALTTSRFFEGYRGRESLRDILMWTLSDGLGLLIVTPALISFTGPKLRAALGGAGKWRAAAMLAAFAATDCMAFLQTRYSVLFVVSAAMLVLVFELETVGAAAGLVLTALIGEGLSVFGFGPTPLVGQTAHESELSLQIFLGVSAVLNLSVGAALARSRRLQADLAESEARYRLLTDKAVDITLRYDPDWIIEFVSPAVRRLGYEPAALIGTKVTDLMHPKDRASTRRARSALAGGARDLDAADLEFRVRCADGKWVWMQGSPSPLTNDKGEVTGALSVWRDVSVRKAAELALAESEAKFRMLAENVSDVITRADLNGVLTYLSPSCETVFGYKPEELVGRNSLDYMHPDDRARVSARVRAVIEHPATGLSIRLEYRLKRKDGQYAWIEADPTLVLDPQSGRPIAIQDCVRDVSARKALEAELVRKQREAEAATIAKSDFLANMSHEIRTPLTGIIGFGALLEEVKGLPPAAVRHIARITTASQTLLSVVNDILDFSKIDAGQIELDPHAFAPAAFITETVTLVSSHAAAKGLALEVRPSGALPVAAFADWARIRQILLNLLTNAIKFTEGGSVTVIADYTMALGGSLRFEVIDTGIGVPEELSHRLFQRFSQVDGSISREFGGTGLGLAICKGLVDAMGGEIGVESQLGQGSTFWFTVPAPAADQVEAEPARESGAFEVGALRILLVDDVEMNRALVVAMLTPFDVEVVEAAGGAEAVSAAMQQPFDLILMDLQMPGMDGLAASRAIRANSNLNYETPILALSANILPAHLAACREAGMNDHIAKPIRPEDLLGKIAHWGEPQRTAAAADGSTARA